MLEDFDNSRKRWSLGRFFIPAAVITYKNKTNSFSESKTSNDITCEGYHIAMLKRVPK